MWELIECKKESLCILSVKAHGPAVLPAPELLWLSGLVIIQPIHSMFQEEIAAEGKQKKATPFPLCRFIVISFPSGVA